jgi:hypothetical protein
MKAEIVTCCWEALVELHVHTFTIGCGRDHDLRISFQFREKH